jgi:hypothetical protein
MNYSAHAKFVNKELDKLEAEEKTKKKQLVESVAALDSTATEEPELWATAMA